MIICKIVFLVRSTYDTTIHYILMIPCYFCGAENKKYEMGSMSNCTACAISPITNVWSSKYNATIYWGYRDKYYNLYFNIIENTISFYELRHGDYIPITKHNGLIKGSTQYLINKFNSYLVFA